MGKHVRIYLVITGILLSLILVLGCSSPAPSPSTTAAPPASTTTQAPASTTVKPSTTTAAPTTTTAAPTTTAAVKAKEISFLGTWPDAHYTTIADKAFMKTVTELTNGSLTFKYYPNQQLYTKDKVAQPLSSGALILADSGIADISMVIPEALVVDGTLYGPLNTYFGVLFDKSKGGGIYDDIIIPALAKKNIKLVGFSTPAAEAWFITTKKPVTKMADYAGMKIRVPAEVHGAIVESWGAKMVLMPSTDVYMALQTGTIDGVLAGANSHIDRKYYEVGKYFQDLPLGGGNYGLMFNMDFWKALTKDEQNAIFKAARQMEIDTTNAAIALDESSRKGMIEKGVERWAPSGDEWAKMQALIGPGQEKLLKPTVGDAVWNAAMKALASVKGNTTPWQTTLNNWTPSY